MIDKDELLEIGELNLEGYQLSKELDLISGLETSNKYILNDGSLETLRYSSEFIYSQLGIDIPKHDMQIIPSNEALIRDIVEKVKTFFRKAINFLKTSFKKMVISASQLEDKFTQNLKKLESIKLTSKVELDVKKANKIARKLAPFTLMTNGELTDKTIDLMTDAMSKYNFNRSLSLQKSFINSAKTAFDKAIKEKGDPRVTFFNEMVRSIPKQQETYNIDFTNMSGYLDNDFYDKINKEGESTIALISFIESKFSAIIFSHNGTADSMILGYFKNKTNKSTVKSSTSSGEFNVDSLKRLMKAVNDNLAKGFSARLKNILSLVSYFESSAKFVTDKANRTNAVEKEFTSLFNMVIKFYNSMPGAMFDEVNNMQSLLKVCNELTELTVKYVENKEA